MNKDLFLIFSERLRYLRENCNLSQKELSEQFKKEGINISKDMISSFERGITEPKFSHIISFCVFFNTTPDFLYGYTQNSAKNINSIKHCNYSILNEFLDENKIDEQTYRNLLQILYKVLKGDSIDDDHKNSNM